MLDFKWKLEFDSNILSVIVGLNYYKDPKGFIEYSNDMQDVYKNTEEHNLGNERKKQLCLMTWLQICVVTKILIQ